MIAKILLIVALVIAGFVVVVVLQPSSFRIERSASLAISPADAFAQVNDLRRYAQWNPWGKLDPAMKTTFAGPSAGQGAIMEWSGNNQVGAGRITVAESRANERVTYALDFLEPLPSTSTAEFTFQAQGDRTLVTWAMFGERSFIPKAFGLFMDMDKMLGGFFEQGLADLEANAKPALAHN